MEATGEKPQETNGPGVAQKTKNVVITHKHPGKGNNVILVLQDAATGRVEKIVETHNLVTTRGTVYYAQRGAGETPSQSFGTANVGVLVAAYSYRNDEAAGRTYGDFVVNGSDFTGKKTFDSGYPKTSDTDTDNTGSGASVVTYRRTYTTAQANYTIKALGIARTGATTTATATLRQLLNYVTLSVAQRVAKTSSQTLKVFINHTFAGA